MELEAKVNKNLRTGSLVLLLPNGRLNKLLFNGNAFREVAWLVDIGALEDGGMVGEELDRNRVKQRRDKRVAARQCDAEGEAVGEASDPGSVRDHHNAAAAGHDLLDITEGLFEEVVIGRQHNDRHILVD